MKTKKITLDFYALYDKEIFVEFMVLSLYANMCYLFFLAIDGKLRSKGYGGQALHILDKLYSDRQLVVDFEMIDENASNITQRIFEVRRT